MNELLQIKVVWQRRFDGFFSAIAEEDRHGYIKGETMGEYFEVTVGVYPTELPVTPKEQGHGV